jgi:hypothetical protein
MLIKINGNAPKNMRGGYRPAECTETRKVNIEGNSDKKHVSISYSERRNLTMRLHMRRFTRLTNGFSKKVEQHSNAFALHFTLYDSIEIQSG